MEDIVFLSHCSCKTLPVLEDHVINDLCIVPAVFQVGMMLEAACHIHGRQVVSLSDLVIPTALLLRSNTNEVVIKLLLIFI